MATRATATARGVRRGQLTGALLLVTMAATTGCNALDNLLEVELPGQIASVDAESPGKASTLLEGGVTLFNAALVLQIYYGGQLGDEFIVRGAPNIETRAFPLGPDEAHYGTLARARWQNDRTLTLLEGWSDAEVANRTSLIARAAVFAGYSNLLMGEAFCTAALDGGPEIQAQELFVRADARFTQAMQAATVAGTTAMLNLARVGRARARLNLGRLPDAKADAILVPSGFKELALYPATVSGVNENLIHVHNYLTNITAIDAAYWDVRFAGVPDPRVGVVNTGQNAASGAPLWRATKYSTRSSPVELGTWEEAQLIVAEADAAAGNLSDAVAIINLLHTRAGLPGFGGGTQAEVRAQIMYERRAELFVEGHHLGDYRRYQLPFVPAAGAIYPYAPGYVYGNARCFPLPLSERNSNPNID